MASALVSLVLDAAYGSSPTPTFQLPDGRLQPDFLMDTLPDWVFFLVSFGLAGLAGYASNVHLYGMDQDKSVLMMYSCALPLLVHWALFFAHALPNQSEKYFDLAGQIGICLMVVFAYCTRFNVECVQCHVVLALVLAWSARLAWFLFSRMVERGEDWRFVKARTHPGYHFFAWTSQGLWCFLQGQAVLALFYSTSDSTRQDLMPGVAAKEEEVVPLVLTAVGCCVWALGLAIESTADKQKLAFVRRHPSRESRQWIEEGLWRYSRHPNFCGESTCWVGVSLVCTAAAVAYGGISWRPLVFAPMFSMLFLQQTTVPWLDLLADAKYAGRPGYDEYCRQTSKFWLLPRRGKL